MYLPVDHALERVAVVVADVCHATGVEQEGS
jgi:hypothetical protein